MKILWMLNAVVLVVCHHDYLTPGYTSNNMNTKSISSPDIAKLLLEIGKENKSSCPSTEKKFCSKAIDCEELFRKGYNKSGVYAIWPRNKIMEEKSLHVYCDMDTDGGGWTVIQRRGNYSRANDYFYKNWDDYKAGFGDIEKDFWLGNDNIFSLSNQRLHSVRFDLKDIEGSTAYALYDKFWIDDESQMYTLHIEDYSGNAGDSMNTHNNMKFSTKDVDNDLQKEEFCAQKYKGGWWYNACHLANLNGFYLGGKHDSFADGVNWKTWKGYHDSLNATEIKIRPKNFRQNIISQPCVVTP